MAKNKVAKVLVDTLYEYLDCSLSCTDIDVFFILKLSYWEKFDVIDNIGQKTKELEAAAKFCQFFLWYNQVDRKS